MDETFLIGLGIKMLVAAAIVVVAAKVVERMDAFFGAMIATLPISAGPSYIFLAMEHGAAFIADSALVSVAINTGTSGFIAVYSYLAQRCGAVVSTVGGLLAWFGIALVLADQAPPLAAALAINLGGLLLALLATRWLIVPGRPKPPLQSKWWDVPFRALVVMSLTASVLIAARLLGPKAAGIGALMPVVFASLTLILHPRLGGSATAEVMINSIVGMFGIASALAVVHLTAVPLGAAPALSLGLLTCLVWNAILILVRTTRVGRPARA